jgi:hypothetical protein
LGKLIICMRRFCSNGGWRTELSCNTSPQIAVSLLRASNAGPGLDGIQYAMTVLFPLRLLLNLPRVLIKPVQDGALVLHVVHQAIRPHNLLGVVGLHQSPWQVVRFVSRDSILGKLKSSRNGSPPRMERSMSATFG